MHQWEQQEEEQRHALDKKGVKSQVWCPRRKADEENDDQGSAADVNMVFILPMEFMAPADRDNATEIEERMAQLVLEPMTATFEKLEDEKC